MVVVKYELILDYHKINTIYKKITASTKHKNKLVYFELNKFSNFMNIYDKLKNKKYVHGHYNIFLIKKPKNRIIMSENLNDKIINHLVSTYYLSPIIEPLLLDENVATRINKGLDAGINYVKNYLNKERNNLNNLYVLKCDIEKYFYNIDHQVLIDKLNLIIYDKDILSIVKLIIKSTDEDYINYNIDKIINNEKDKIIKSNRKEKDKIYLINKLDSIPRYIKGKGLPIGNMTSQLLAIYYLNDIDHFIREKLGIKYYVRYMDDFILFHHDKNYLKYCKKEIEYELAKIKLKLNKKTCILKLNSGFVFLGYRFLIKNNRSYILISKNMKQKIRKRYKKNGIIIFDRYNGYLKRCNSGSFIYNLINK